MPFPNLISGSSFTTIPYTTGAAGSPPAYATAFTGGTTAVGINVGSSVTSIYQPGSIYSSSGSLLYAGSSTVYTDPYPYGTPITIQGPSNTNTPGTNAAFIAGNYVSNGSGNPLTMTWRTRTQNEMDKGSSSNNNLGGGAGWLSSEVMQMSGQQAGSTYVLQMDYSPEVETPADAEWDAAHGGLYLGAYGNSPNSSISVWQNAVDFNVANTVRSGKTLIQLPAVGTYSFRPASELAAYPYGTPPINPQTGAPIYSSAPTWDRFSSS